MLAYFFVVEFILQPLLLHVKAASKTEDARWTE